MRRLDSALIRFDESVLRAFTVLILNGVVTTVLHLLVQLPSWVMSRGKRMLAVLLSKTDEEQEGHKPYKMSCQ